jgi:hypothetical protein
MKLTLKNNRMLNKLKLTNEEQHQQQMSVEETMRQRLLAKLVEQRQMAEADIAGTGITKTRRIYVTNDAGERVEQTVLRRLRRWYWQNGAGVWLMELRYGNKPLKLVGGKSAVEVGEQSQLLVVIDTLMEAVVAGELDKALAAARTARLAQLKRFSVN